MKNIVFFLKKNFPIELLIYLHIAKDILYLSNFINEHSNALDFF